MRSQNFGIEIEMTGLTRSAAARIIAGHFGTQAHILSYSVSPSRTLS